MRPEKPKLPIPDAQDTSWYQAPIKQAIAPNMRRPMAQTLTLEGVEYHCIPMQHVDYEVHSGQDYRKFFALTDYFLPDVVESHSVPLYHQEVQDHEVINQRSVEKRLIPASIFYPSIILFGVCYLLSPVRWHEEFDLAQRKMKEQDENYHKSQQQDSRLKRGSALSS